MELMESLVTLFFPSFIYLKTEAGKQRNRNSIKHFVPHFPPNFPDIVLTCETKRRTSYQSEEKEIFMPRMGIKASVVCTRFVRVQGFDKNNTINRWLPI